MKCSFLCRMLLTVVCLLAVSCSNEEDGQVNAQTTMKTGKTLVVYYSYTGNKTTVFTPAPVNTPDGRSRMVWRLQFSKSIFLMALASPLLRKVFLMTMPARPPAFSILMKCCMNI